MLDARSFNRTLSIFFLGLWTLFSGVIKVEYFKSVVMWIAFPIIMGLVYLLVYIVMGIFVTPVINFIFSLIFGKNMFNPEEVWPEAPSLVKDDWYDLTSEQKNERIKQWEYEDKEKKRLRNLDLATSRYKSASLTLSQRPDDKNAQRRRDEAFADMMKYK